MTEKTFPHIQKLNGEIPQGQGGLCVAEKCQKSVPIPDCAAECRGVMMFENSGNTDNLKHREIIKKTQG